MRDFESLDVWRAAHRLVLAVYQLVAVLPPEERFGLADQMRRSAVSIPANIAEGSGMDTNAQFARQLAVASGSSAELEYYAHLCLDLGYLNRDQFLALRKDIRAIRRQIWGLIRYLRRTRADGGQR